MEKLTVSQLVKEFPVFYKPLLQPVLSQLNLFLAVFTEGKQLIL
jgi:hypothetical protein